VQPRIVCVTSDHYLPAVKPFAWLLNKYWKPEPQVLIVGFTPPQFNLPSNFSFYSVGPFENYPWERWSDALIHAIHHAIPEDRFIIMLEDYWITRPVDTRNVEILYNYMGSHPKVLKVDLCGDRLYAGGADTNYGSVEHIDLVKSKIGSPYHMSLMPGIWRRQNLLRVLIPGESPHQLEMTGTTRLSAIPELEVFGTRQWPLKITLGLRARDSSKINLDDLNGEDISQMKALGFFKPWGQ